MTVPPVTETMLRASAVSATAMSFPIATITQSASAARSPPARVSARTSGCLPSAPSALMDSMSAQTALRVSAATVLRATDSVSLPAQTSQDTASTTRQP
jgi:hypothetical protein